MKTPYLRHWTRGVITMTRSAYLAHPDRLTPTEESIRRANSSGWVRPPLQKVILPGEET